MGKELDVAAALRVLEAAFLPLKCIAESVDHGNGARFRIVDASGDTSLNVDGLLRGQLSDACRLEGLILHARENLSERGYKLADWAMPSTT
jgi:hypothetical protein